MPWVSAVYQQRIALDSEGRAIVPDRPGWGFDFDPDVVQRYSVA
jgi:L-alanine-DL-glutamate epimerase-like enolase superfamily enzyme